MQNLDTRSKSFEAITKPKSKIKPAFPLSPEEYPRLNADTLSRAGFYHTPGTSEDSLDNCKCFLCDVELGGWDQQDDPFEEHARRGNCAWADMICAVVVERRKREKSGGAYVTTYNTPESLPQSVESAAVREQTYKKWWPHKQKSGWLPTVKNLARAGFVYNPSTNSKDGVVCPYCDYAVEGWEATDDPWQVHSKKLADCHFFRAQLEGGGPSEEKATKVPAKGKKSEAVKRSKRGTTAAPSVVSEAEDEPLQSTELPSEAESIALSQSTTTKKKAAKPRATTTRRKTAARGKKKATTAEPEEEPEIIEVADDTITSISQTQLPKAVPEEAEPEEVQEKKGKSKKTTKAKPRATTAKSKGKKKIQEVQSEDEEIIPSGSEVERDTDHEIEDNQEPEVEEEVEIDSIPQNRLRQPSKPVSVAASSTSQSKSSAKSSKSTSSKSKPLPPLPLPSPVHVQSPPSRPLSQLDRFTNIPPSSPITQSTDFLSPKPKSLLRSTNQPTIKASSPQSRKNLPREVLETSLNRGAIEARKVIEDLMSSPISATVPNVKSNKASSGGEEGETGGILKLSEEEKGMTLEDLIRMEMKRRYQEMQKEGEDMIDKWQEKAKSERKRIETI